MRRQVLGHRTADQHVEQILVLLHGTVEIGEVGFRLRLEQHRLVIIHRRGHARIEPHLRDPHALLAARQRAFRQRDPLVARHDVEEGRRDLRDQGQAIGARALLGGEIALPLPLRQIADPPPQVELKGGNADIGAILGIFDGAARPGRPRRCAQHAERLVAARRAAVEFDSRQAGGHLDTILRPCLCHPCQRLGEILVIGERQGDERLQSLVHEKILPREFGGQLAIMVVERGAKGAIVARHRHHRLAIGRREVAATEQQHGQRAGLAKAGFAKGAIMHGHCPPLRRACPHAPSTRPHRRPPGHWVG